MSGRKGRGQTAHEAKQARQKKIVIVGTVLLVGLLIFQVPRTLKTYHKLSGKPPAASAASASAPGVVPATATPSPATTLPNTDTVVVQPTAGQLASFGLFKTKDPFVQQVGGSQSTSPTPTTPVPTATTPVATPVPPAPVLTTPAVTLPSVTTPLTTPAPPVALPTTPAPVTLPSTTSPAPPTPTPTHSTPAPTPTATTPTPPAPRPQTPSAVAISTNGRCETVPIKGQFPGSEDIFKVVSIAANVASIKIGIVGGSYESGSPAITLKRGTPLTLVNSADGLRYKLTLLPSCAGQPGPAPTAATTTTKSTGTLTVPTPAPPPPTTSTTPTSTTSTTSP